MRGDNRKDSDIDIMILVDLQDEQMEALSDVLSELDFAENGTKEDLVMHRLAVAREDLDTAYILLDLKKYRGANNRAYYAIYHTIDAVLAQEGKQLLELAEHYLRDQKDVSE